MKRRQKTEEQGQIAKRTKRNVRVDRPAIINETPVDGDKLDAMEKAVKDGDFREMFGIKDGVSIEVQWSDGGRWTPAVVDKVETGTTHRFHDKDLPDDQSEIEYENDDELDHDFIDVPVVTIYKHGERQKREICFINRCLIYDITEGEIFNWKMFGDPWVGDTEDGDVEEFNFTTEEELKRQIESFVPRVMCNVLEKNRNFFDDLPQSVQTVLTKEVLDIKNMMVDKIVNFFIERESLVPGRHVVMDKDSMQSLCDQVLHEIYEKNI